MGVVTDPIADLLTRIRNANSAGHDSLEVSASKMKLEIVKILQREGFIRRYEYLRDKPVDRIRIYLKYGPKRERVLTDLKRVSKPGRRVYVKAEEIPRVMGGLGIAILSTDRGVITDKQARKARVGGELLCYVW